ncbi:MAG TPA: ubiquitin-like small modifier protein 1 [Mycobacteriales bacterium]|nr:ubiquitin-like small modifier protein 1 [Mycobacteriales bacterium]
MDVTVWLAGALRPHAGGRTRVPVQVSPGTTVGGVLDRLFADAPSLARRVRDERGTLRRHVNVFVGTTNIRDAAGLDTPVGDGIEISVLPATSGG